MARRYNPRQRKYLERRFVKDPHARLRAWHRSLPIARGFVPLIVLILAIIILNAPVA